MIFDPNLINVDCLNYSSPPYIYEFSATAPGIITANGWRLAPVVISPTNDVSISTTPLYPSHDAVRKVYLSIEAKFDYLYSYGSNPHFEIKLPVYYYSDPSTLTGLLLEIDFYSDGIYYINEPYEHFLLNDVSIGSSHIYGFEFTIDTQNLYISDDTGSSVPICNIDYYKDNIHKGSFLYSAEYTTSVKNVTLRSNKFTGKELIDVLVKTLKYGAPSAELPLSYRDAAIDVEPYVTGTINLPLLTIANEMLDNRMLEMPMLDFDSKTIVGKKVSSSPSLPFIDTSFDLRVYDLQTSLSMPLLSVDGNVTYYDRYGDVTITLPAITGMIYGGASVAIILPSIVSISSGKVSRFGTVTIVLPAIDSVATALVSESCDVALMLPAITAKVTGSTNFLATIAAVLPVLDIVSVGFTGEVATTAIVLPKIKSISTAWWNSKANVSIILPAIRAGINTVILAIDYEVLVLNTKNMALTNYVSFAYNSLYEFNGKFFGAKSSGIYELTGTTDDGSAIEWKIKTGKLDMREHEKHSPKKMYAVLSYRPSGDLTLTVIGEDEEYEYDVESYEQIDGLSRVKLGKGIRDKYLQFELKNKNGESIFLDKMKIFSNKATIK